MPRQYDVRLRFLCLALLGLSGRIRPVHPNGPFDSGACTDADEFHCLLPPYTDSSFARLRSNNELVAPLHRNARGPLCTAASVGKPL